MCIRDRYKCRQHRRIVPAHIVCGMENDMEKQKIMYDSGNELAAYAARQINYHVMGYYPITPSTQIAENLDVMGAEGLHDIALIAAEGEHSAAGICYGASAAGGRVFNATSANGLLYALEPVSYTHLLHPLFCRILPSVLLPLPMR